jgi:DNA-binding MarR family transcriptional regulator
LVQTTEDGRRLIERLVASWRALSAPLLKKLGPEDLATVAKALRVILEATRDKRED